MDSARDINTKKIVDAEQLELLLFVKMDGYLCRSCEAIVTPCSYQAHNKKRAYFSAKQGHQLGCDIDGEIELKKQARKERIANSAGFSGIFPRKLVLRNERSIVDEATDPVTSTKNAKKTVEHDDNDIEKKCHYRTTSTIRPICRMFIDFPFNRDQPLTIPGISGNTYRYIFKCLKKDEIIVYPKIRIFYAPIQWTKSLFVDNEYGKIFLGYGEWCKEEKKFKKPYKVHIHWENWSKAKRDFVAKDIEEGRLGAIAASKVEENKKKGWLFFIGDQDSDDPALFHVNDHRLICCHVDEIIYPPN